MRWLTRALAVLALTLSISTTALAADPGGTTPGAALALVNSASGTITGSGAGSFNYFMFQYPGDSSYGTVSVTYSPTDEPTANAFGVTLYQGDVQLNTMKGISATVGMNSMPFTGGSTAGPILVQVYNYNPGVAVSYTLTLSGVKQTMAAPPPAPAQVPAPVASPAGTSVNSPGSLTTPISNTLAGSTAGSFATYTVSYPGDDSVQSIHLYFSPGGPDVGAAVFVTIFQNGSQIVSLDGAQGPTTGQLVVNYSSTSSAPITVQLANYSGSTISYTIAH